MDGKEYSFRVDPSPSGGWSVWFPDLPGCEGWVLCLNEVGQEAQTISRMWLESATERGYPIPEPQHLDEDRWVEGTTVRDETGLQITGVPDVAKILGVSERRVQALAKERSVGKRFGNYLVFTESDIALLRPQAPGRPRSSSVHAAGK